MNRRTLLLCGGLGVLSCSLLTPPFLDPPRLHGSVNDRACRICHPGSTDGLEASVHGMLLSSPESAETACSVCHGALLEHRADPGVPVPAVQAAACNACHQGADVLVGTAAHRWESRRRAAPAPTQSMPDPPQGLEWSGLWTLGYRFISRSGSAGRYDTDLNLDAGFRLLEAEVEGRGGGSSWADLVRLSVDGLDDPYTDARFEIDKGRSYRGLFEHTENEVIYDTTGDFHNLTRNSKRSSLQGSVWLGEDVELFASLSRLDRDSFWLVNRFGSGFRFEDVQSPRHLVSDVAELGATLSSGATAATLAFDYLDEESLDRWFYMAPSAMDPTFVESEDFTSDSSLRGPGGRAAFSTGSDDWSLDVTARYIDLDRRVGGAGRTEAFNVDEFTIDTTSSSQGSATTWLVDGTLTWDFADDAALIFDLRWLDHDEKMTINQQEVLDFPNLGFSLTTDTNLVNETDQKKLTGSVQTDYSPLQSLQLSLGYGFSREELRVPDLQPGDNDFLSGTISDHGLLAGVRWRPDEHWILLVDYEDYRQSGAQLHELAEDDGHRLRTSLTYQGDGHSLQAFVRQRRAENEISLYKTDSTSVGATGSWHREEGLDVFGSYVYSDLDSRTLTNFYFDPDPNPVPTFVGFTGETHTVAGGLSARPGAVAHWQIDLAWTDTEGSFDVSLLDWGAELGLSVWPGGELGIRYRNVDYRDQSQLDDYDADLVFVYWRQIIGAR